jgi:S-adenosylmethionine/arginine decarboxylase-like enzyme
MSDDLGSRLLLAAFAVRGTVDEERAKQIIDSIIETIGVSRAHTAITYPYPIDGKGGTGFTVLQPITESFLAVDSWPDHGGAYVVIASCKWFEVELVRETLQGLGLHIIGDNFSGLTLDHAQEVRNQ